MQDADIEEMIKFWRASDTSGVGDLVRHNTIAMLQELLKLRKKARNEAAA